MGLGQLVLYLLKLGTIGFGGPAALVGYVRAVAVAMITPGPVVITVAFVGYLVAGTAGAIAAAIGIFLPVYLFTIVPAPWFRRHRENPQLRAFTAGATAAASGAIAGSVIVVGQRAIFDLPTAAIALIGLALLWKYRLQEPMLVAVAGLAGLLLWPIMRGG
jgi:chromate transporter